METMRDRFTTVATELLDKDPRIVLLLADIGSVRGVRARSAPTACRSNDTMAPPL